MALAQGGGARLRRGAALGRRARRAALLAQTHDGRRLAPAYGGGVQVSGPFCLPRPGGCSHACTPTPRVIRLRRPHDGIHRQPAVGGDGTRHERNDHGPPSRTEAVRLWRVVARHLSARVRRAERTSRCAGHRRCPAAAAAAAVGGGRGGVSGMGCRGGGRRGASGPGRQGGASRGAAHTKRVRGTTQGRGAGAHEGPSRAGGGDAVREQGAGRVPSAGEGGDRGAPCTPCHLGGGARRQG